MACPLRILYDHVCDHASYICMPFLHVVYHHIFKMDYNVMFEQG